MLASRIPEEHDLPFLHDEMVSSLRRELAKEEQKAKEGWRRAAVAERHLEECQLLISLLCRRQARISGQWTFPLFRKLWYHLRNATDPFDAGED